MIKESIRRSGNNNDNNVYFPQTDIELPRKDFQNNQVISQEQLKNYALLKQQYEECYHIILQKGASKIYIFDN